MSDQSAYMKGVYAAEAGSPEESNPYALQSLSWFDWNRGWYFALDMMTRPQATGESA